MAAVFPQVRGDAVRATSLRESSRLDRVRVGRAPRLPHRRHVIDIDTEQNPELAPLVHPDFRSKRRDDVLGEPPDLVRVLALDHDASERLGTGVADEHPSPRSSALSAARIA